MNWIDMTKHCVFRSWLLLVLAGHLADNVRGQEPSPLDADRPDFTESAIVVPQRSLQWEGGYTYTRTGEGHNHTLGELLFRYGFTRRLEGRLAVNSLFIRGTTGNRVMGWQDVGLGLKIQLWRGSDSSKWRPDSSLIIGTTVPTGLGDNTLQPIAKWCLAWEIPWGFSAGTNFNYWHRREEGLSFGEWAGSLSVGHDVTRRIGCYGEFFGFKPTSSSVSSSRYLSGGVTYLVTPSFRLDFRLGRGFSPEEPDFFVGAGFVKRW